MTQTWPDWETLNAYIDGELSARESAAVARALVNRQDLAEQVALISRLKVAVQESVPDNPVELPPDRQALPWRTLVAASALLLVALLGFVMWPGGQPQQIQARWLEQTRALHGAWVEASASVAPSPLLPASGRHLRAYVPDLSSARLTVTHVATVKDARYGEIIHIGYSGTRGCRVSFFMLALDSELSESLVDLSTDGRLAFAWRAGGTGHLILADGMDAQRAGLIARTVHRATLDRLPLNEETRMALGKSRAQSRPCAA